MDARSHEPIRNVTVQRRRARNSHDVMEVPKGGELLKQPPVVRTDADGFRAGADVGDDDRSRGRGYARHAMVFGQPEAMVTGGLGALRQA